MKLRLFATAMMSASLLSAAGAPERLKAATEALKEVMGGTGSRFRIGWRVDEEVERGVWLDVDEQLRVSKLDSG